MNRPRTTALLAVLLQTISVMPFLLVEAMHLPVTKIGMEENEKRAAVIAGYPLLELEGICYHRKNHSTATLEMENLMGVVRTYRMSHHRFLVMVEESNRSCDREKVVTMTVEVTTKTMDLAVERRAGMESRAPENSHRTLNSSLSYQSSEIPAKI